MTTAYKHSYKVEDRLLSSLSVYNVGYQKCEPGYTWGPGVRDHYLIHYVIRGEGYYAVNDRTYHLRQGDAFLVYPGKEVRYWAHEEHPWEYSWVGFAGSDAVTILNNTGFDRKYPVLQYGQAGFRMEENIMRIYEAKGNAFRHGVSMTGALYTMLGELMGQERANSNKSSGDLKTAYVKKALQYMDERYSYPITVEDVAGYTGISRSHLFRLFQNVRGESPKEYLTACRLKQAVRLLTETDLTVRAIAYSVGFDNNLYFSKAFRKCMGKSPSECRMERGL